MSYFGGGGAVSVRVNLLNSFFAVALTLRPIARCIWAGGGGVMWGESHISIKHIYLRE